MSPRHAIMFTLATLFFACAPTIARAQVRFGTPVGTDQGSKAPDAVEFGLTPPTREQLFRVQSEPSLKERFRRALPNVKNVEFPKEAAKLPDVPATESAPFPELATAPIGSPVCYRPLYFEDQWTDRYGNYVPCVQPLISAGRFYADVLLLPCRMALTPPWTFECDNR